MRIIFLFFISIFFLGDSAYAYFETETAGSQKSEMNGIGSHDYGDFSQSWHLVTVRFRTDTGEMRFVYANDLAWKTLNSLKPDYPDGAVFGKIALKTEDDPSFTSSKVPSGAKRFQLMVKNKKKYKETQGWGFALFDQDGHLFKEDPATTTKGCIACHQIVPELGYVFSRPASLSLFGSNQETTSFAHLAEISPFKEQPASATPATVKTLVPTHFKSIYSLEGALKQSGFSGTLDEVVPLLISEAKKTGAPALLYLDARNFSLVVPQTTSNKCAAGLSMSQIRLVFNGKTVRDTHSCD